MDDAITRQLETSHIPGAACVVVRRGEVIFAKGYGHADLEKKTPVLADKTVFRAASVSKVFTATAVMQLVERGMLNLHEDVNKQLKLFKIPPTYPQPVTLAHLLTHTAGFDERNIARRARRESEMRPLGEYLARRLPPRVYPAGELINYSNHGMALAGYLVEVVAGTPFPQYLDEHVLKPLEMARSGFVLTPSLAADLAVGYRYRGRLERRAFDYVNTVPSSMLVTTATDVARFMIAHLQHGRYGERRILAEATAVEMHRPQFRHHPRMPGIAYGFLEREQNSHRAIWHDGGTPGFASLLYLIPDEGVGIFLVYNLEDGARAAEELLSKWLDRYYPVKTHFSPSKPRDDLRNRAQAFTGTYRYVRYARASVEKLDSFMRGPLRLVPHADGSIGSPGGRGYVEVESLLFQRNDGRLLAFREDARGRITHAFLGFAAYERLRWYETPAFQKGIVAFYLAVFLSGCLLWLVRSLLRRWRKQAQEPRMRRVAGAVAGLVSVLNLAFIIGMALTLMRLRDEVQYGVPLAIIVMLLIPLLTTILTAGLLPLTVWMWKANPASIATRLHYSLVTLAALLFIPFLMYWNLLGFRY